MKAGTRRRIFVACLVAAVSAGALLLIVSSGEREPSYQGRSLSSWMNAFPINWTEVSRREKSQEEQARAEEAIRQMGTNTIPIFLRWVQAKDGPMKARIISFFGTHPGIPFTPLGANQKHMLAFRGFQALGPAAKGASADLLQISNTADNEAKALALSALQVIHRPEPNTGADVW